MVIPYQPSELFDRQVRAKGSIVQLQVIEKLTDISWATCFDQEQTQGLVHIVEGQKQGQLTRVNACKVFVPLEIVEQVQPDQRSVN